MKTIIEKAKKFVNDAFGREFESTKEVNELSSNLYCKIKEEVNRMKASCLFAQEEVVRFEEQIKDALYKSQIDTKKRTAERLRKEWEVFK